VLGGFDFAHECDGKKEDKKDALIGKGVYISKACARCE
jgi:hypothetical protein